jgi:hypothetical protein
MIRTLLLGLTLSILAWGALAADPEFEGQCAMSMANRVHLPTTCSVVWISPEDKLYCFSDERAKQAFLRSPADNERKARAFWEDPSFWEKLKREGSSAPEG